MAKFKLQAGAEFDTMTADEMRGVLADAMRSWAVETTRGVRFSRIIGQGTIASAAVTITGPALGPAAGFVWDVRRLRIIGGAAADTFTVYVNSTDVSGEVCTTDDFTKRLITFTEQLVLYPGDVLYIVGASLAGTGTVTVTGQVRELPVTLAWRLGN